MNPLICLLLCALMLSPTMGAIEDPLYFNFVTNVIHKSSRNTMVVKLISIDSIRKGGKTLYNEETLKKNLNKIELFKRMSKSPNVVDFYGFGVRDFSCMFQPIEKWQKVCAGISEKHL